LLNNYDICLCAAQPRTESARRGRYHQWPKLGGLPITAVIVRSSADINACGQTSLSCYIHGLCLLLSAMFFEHYLNNIPLACLSAILLHTGYKLAKPALFHRKLPKGMSQLLPFVITVLSVLVIDLLTGMAIGVITGLFFCRQSQLSCSYYINPGRHALTVLIQLKIFLFRTRRCQENSFCSSMQTAP